MVDKLSHDDKSWITCSQPTKRSLKVLKAVSHRMKKGLSWATEVELVIVLKQDPSQFLFGKWSVEESHACDRMKMGWVQGLFILSRTISL